MFKGRPALLPLTCDQECHQRIELFVRWGVLGNCKLRVVYRHCESAFCFYGLRLIEPTFQCATETGMPIHRVGALAPSPTVTWHPSKYVFAYCGQTKLREGQPPPTAVISLFGGGI